MGKVTVTGASDDLIEVEGDLVEEFGFFSDDVSFVHFSDGTVLTAVYDDNGIWRFDRYRKGTATYEHKEGCVEEDTNDVVTLTGDLQWVEHWRSFDPSHDEMCDALEQLMDDQPWNVANLDNRQLLHIWRVFSGHATLDLKATP